MSESIYTDEELSALDQIVKIMLKLDGETRARMIRYLDARWGVPSGMPCSVERETGR